jgi:hypothetical protein
MGFLLVEASLGAQKVVQGGIPEEGPRGEETDHGLSANRIVLPSTR